MQWRWNVMIISLGWPENALLVHPSPVSYFLPLPPSSDPPIFSLPFISDPPAVFLPGLPSSWAILSTTTPRTCIFKCHIPVMHCIKRGLKVLIWMKLFESVDENWIYQDSGGEEEEKGAAKTGHNRNLNTIFELEHRVSKTKCRTVKNRYLCA